jgi:hypothetical protein
MSKGGKTLLLLSRSLYQEKDNEESIGRKVAIAYPAALGLCPKTSLPPLLD